MSVGLARMALRLGPMGECCPHDVAQPWLALKHRDRRCGLCVEEMHFRHNQTPGPTGAAVEPGTEDNQMPKVGEYAKNTLPKSTRARLARAWDETQAAEDFAPLPAGEYIAHIISGTLSTARTGTPSYKLAFMICEGAHEGRKFWHDLWLTTAAMPQTKRDLCKLGVTSIDMLERPLPAGIRCRCQVVLQTADDGTKYNRVKRFEVVGADKPETGTCAASGARGGESAQTPPKQNPPPPAKPTPSAAVAEASTDPFPVPEPGVAESAHNPVEAGRKYKSDVDRYAAEHGASEPPNTSKREPGHESAAP